jgi:hypothetical protein
MPESRVVVAGARAHSRDVMTSARLAAALLLATSTLLAACPGGDDAPAADAPNTDAPADAPTDAPDVDASPDAAIDAAIDAPEIDGPDLADCNVELPCPAPNAGRMTVCGRLWDVETEDVVAATAPIGAACSGITSDGPCSLSVRFFDALDYASNPQGAVPVPAESVVVDDCGRYRATNLPNPTFGFLAVVTDDASGEPDDHAPTGIALATAQGQPARGLRAYATRRATDAAWTASTGLTGMSFATRGVLVAVFAHGTTPIAGVQIRASTTPVAAASTFTFSDTGATRALAVAQPEVTGANGSVLVIDQPTPVPFDGAGGEPATCQWPSSLAAAIPGSVFVQHKLAETPGGAPCPQP